MPHGRLAEAGICLKEVLVLVSDTAPSHSVKITYYTHSPVLSHLTRGQELCVLSLFVMSRLRTLAHHAYTHCCQMQKFTKLLVQLSIFLIDLFVTTYRLSSHARLEAFVIHTKYTLLPNANR